MPLLKGYSRATVTKNVRREYHAGKPLEQAVAIALNTARRSFRHAHPRAKMPKYLGGGR